VFFASTAVTVIFVLRAKVFTDSSQAVKVKQVFQKISTPCCAAGSIFCKNLDSPKPYTIVALETKNDRREDDA
jgi:hypothetical protein